MMVVNLKLIYGLQLLVLAQCLLHFKTLPRSRPVLKETPGEALFLTPYVESGNIEEGRKLAHVSLTDSLANITSYSGFFTVNKTYDSNLFFWYFPPIKSEKAAPVIVWLQGGPGSSSLFGLFEENGPFTVRNYTIHYREHNWALNHHLIYIDNPVGTGFSFTRDKRGYCTNQEQVANDLYSTVVQFLQLFPELQQNDFFISGESYAGKYIPALAYAIHQRNPQAKIKVNLQGLVIGDGLIDPVNQIEYSEFLQQIGLLDWNTVKGIKYYEGKIKEKVKNELWPEANKGFGDLLAHLENVAGYISLYNYLQLNSVDADYIVFIENETVRKQIHVGNVTFHDIYDEDNQAHKYLQNDKMKSVAPWVAELLSHYKVYIFNGQLDIIIAYSLVVNFLKHLNFSASDEYNVAIRNKWHVGNDIAGYVKQAGNLTEIMVRNAGHMVPKDQPVWSLDMIERITHKRPFKN